MGGSTVDVADHQVRTIDIKHGRTRNAISRTLAAASSVIRQRGAFHEVKRCPENWHENSAEHRMGGSGPLTGRFARTAARSEEGYHPPRLAESGRSRNREQGKPEAIYVHPARSYDPRLTDRFVCLTLNDQPTAWFEALSLRSGLLRCTRRV